MKVIPRWTSRTVMLSNKLDLSGRAAGPWSSQSQSCHFTAVVDLLFLITPPSGPQLTIGAINHCILLAPITAYNISSALFHDIIAIMLSILVDQKAHFNIKLWLVYNHLTLTSFLKCFAATRGGIHAFINKGDIHLQIKNEYR